MISDFSKHDTAIYYAYQKILHKYILDNGIVAAIIIYITDGAPQHLKNMLTFVRLIHYKDDCNINGESHFHATAHGKLPQDKKNLKC